MRCCVWNQCKFPAEFGRQVVNAGTPEKTWYTYDASGQRVRKVTKAQSGTRINERIYFGGFEVYRKFGPNALTRETLHIMDDKQRIAFVDTQTAPTPDAQPPTFAITDWSGGESGQATFTVTLSAPSTQTVTVEYMTYSGSALAGADFTSTSSTLVPIIN